MTRRSFFRFLPAMPLAVIAVPKTDVPHVPQDTPIERAHWDQLVAAVESR